MPANNLCRSDVMAVEDGNLLNHITPPILIRLLITPELTGAIKKSFTL